MRHQEEKDKSKKYTISFEVDESLFQRLEDFRYNHRFAARGQAIRWLLNWALEKNPNPKVV